MAILAIPEDHDDSPKYQVLRRDAETDYAARLAESGAGRAGLYSVYEQLEQQSRGSPNYRQLLMTAIIAGEDLVSTTSNDVDVCDVRLSLADLLIRRSRWDSIARLPDLDRASVHLFATLNGEIESSMRLTVLKNLGAVSEEKYQRIGDEKDLEQAHQYLQEAAKLAGSSEERGILLASAACLRFKLDPNALKCILDMPIDMLQSTPVSWSDVARKRFRFIDARRLAAGKSLRVVEFDALPRQRYVALSYVWRGSHVEGIPLVAKIMSIEGAIGADPISIDVLIVACKCVAMLGCELLWIDGVCIIQNDDEDKAWQIQNMFDIYKYCKECLILPGGLARLVPLDEPTSWIHRAWTLQEAIAPPSSTVLFAWTQGDCILQTHMPLGVIEVEPGKAAKADLYPLLMQNMIHHARVIKPAVSYSSAERIPIRILIDDHEDSQATALLGAREGDGKGLGSAIWRAALMRVSSRPADAVFSIMGLLNVRLDPMQFDPNNRVGATIALMQAILARCEPAEWLAAAPNLDIHPKISTLPKFPVIDSRGRALAETKDGLQPISDAMGDTWWRLIGMPSGASMDTDGSLSMLAHTVPIRQEPPPDTPDSYKIYPGVYNMRKDKLPDTGPWYVASQELGPPYAVTLGRKVRYNNPARPMIKETRPWLLMLVDVFDGKQEDLKNLGYAEASQEIIDLEGWEAKHIIIAAAADGPHHIA